ncbi:MAG: RNA polymerase sigma factor [Pikeienuella sp.]
MQLAMPMGSGPGPGSDEADGALLAATATGDMAAFERLHRRFYRRLYGFALRITERPEVAEEVVADTLMAVWQGASKFRGASKASTWIFGIAYRIALKARRKGRHDWRHDEIDETVPAAQSGTEEVETLFTKNRVAAALRRLPEEQRATVELTYLYGYKISEISEITGCPEGTVKTRMFHARAKLRVLLAEPEESEETP